MVSFHSGEGQKEEERIEGIVRRDGHPKVVSPTQQHTESFEGDNELKGVIKREKRGRTGEEEGRKI